MTFLNEMACFFGLDKPTDLVLCFVLSNGLLVFNIIYIALLVIIVGGWSWQRSINEGMMIGGFLVFLIGIGMAALGWITVKLIMFALLVFVAGIIITVIKRNSRD